MLLDFDCLFSVCHCFLSFARMTVCSIKGVFSCGSLFSFVCQYLLLVFFFIYNSSIIVLQKYVNDTHNIIYTMTFTTANIH